MRNLILILCLFPLLAGCATVIHGTTQEISVTSDPAGANVNVDGAVNYTTPVTVELTRKMDHLLTVTKEGFKIEVVKIMHVISGAVAGNLLAGGFIGWGIDAASGAQYKLVPETVHVTLKPEGYVEKEVKSSPGLEKDKMRLEYEKLNLERAKMGLDPVGIPKHLKEPIQKDPEDVKVEESINPEQKEPEYNFKTN